MALNPNTNTTMAGRVTAPNADYPYGSARDESTPGANDGTPYFKGRADDIFGWQQALLEGAGITPSGNAETATASQYVEAMVNLPWLATVPYQKGTPVRVGETYYVSLVDNNLNHPPASSAAQWSRLAQFEIWNAARPGGYGINTAVLHVTGLYRSTVANNTEEPPGAGWAVISPDAGSLIDIDDATGLINVNLDAAAAITGSQLQPNNSIVLASGQKISVEEFLGVMNGLIYTKQNKAFQAVIFRSSTQFLRDFYNNTNNILYLTYIRIVNTSVLVNINPTGFAQQGDAAGINLGDLSPFGQIGESTGGTIIGRLPQLPDAASMLVPPIKIPAQSVLRLPSSAQIDASALFWGFWE